MMEILAFFFLGTFLLLPMDALDEFVQCGFPGLPFNAIIFPADQSQFSDGDIVQYECEEGWALLGPASRMCQSGAWTGTPPICRENIALGQPATQSDTLWDFNPELAVDGNMNSSCSFTTRSLDQRWWQVQLSSQTNIESVAITINSDTFQHFTIFVIELLQGNKALYKPCSKFEGYFKEARAIFLCNNGDGHKGQFVYIKDEREEQEYLGLCEVQVFPKMNATDCGYPEQSYQSTVHLEGNIASYSCNLGYLIQEADMEKRHCRADGYWSGAAPTCKPVTCTDPSSPMNGYIEVSQYSGVYEYGSVASYHCNPGYRLDTANGDMMCGDQGTWVSDHDGGDQVSGVWVTHQGSDGSSPRCVPITCDEPPMVDHAVLELVNGSTNLNTLLLYTCEAGYYDQLFPQSITVSRCQSDSTWTPVSLSCIFDPAAVARNVQGTLFEYDQRDSEGSEFNLSFIITVVSISVALILTIIIVIVILKHRKMKDRLLRSQKMSRVTAGGVKVLPDYLFSPTPIDDNQCKERPKSRSDPLNADLEKTGGSDSIISKFPSKSNLYHKPRAVSPTSSGVSPLAPRITEPKLSAPDVTLTINKIVTEKEIKSDYSDECLDIKVVSKSDDQIYESLNTFVSEKPQTIRTSESREQRTENREDATNVQSNRNGNLYAKVKKMNSSDTTQQNSTNCANLNSDFVSIYELTKVESHRPQPKSEPSKESDRNVFKATPALVNDEQRKPSSDNFSFALDFSPKREINKVSFASNFQPDNDEDIMGGSCDHINDSDENEDLEDETDFRSHERLVQENRSRSRTDFFKTLNNRSQIEEEPIPKMQQNMFIQKDGKQANGGRKWPKVETTFCRQNKIAEAQGSPTKQLILKYNTGVVRPDNESAEKTNSLANRRLNTKNLIKKWHNPESLNNSTPVTAGFQGVQSIMHEINRADQQSEETLVRRGQGRDTILKRNNGVHGWQAADI